MLHFFNRIILILTGAGFTQLSRNYKDEDNKCRDLKNLPSYIIYKQTYHTDVC